MRDNSINTDSVLEKLSRAAAANGASESHDPTPSRTDPSSGDGERELETLMEQITGTLPVDEVGFEESLVKENLEELLLMLIAVHEESHGEELLTDIERVFDTRLSPGTVYPSLHDLDERDVLSMHANVRTKEYSIVDHEYADERIEAAMIQHLAFGMLFYAFLQRY